MRFSRRLGLITAALLLLGAATVSVAQLGTGRVRGQVLDGSDAVVPGATVEAIVSGRVVATTVTDEKGQFQLPAVPAGAVTLKLSLDGFETSTLDLVIQPGLETWVSGLLKVASLSETVLVTAPRPAAAPAPAAPAATAVRAGARAATRPGDGVRTRETASRGRRWSGPSVRTCARPSESCIASATS